MSELEQLEGVGPKTVSYLNKLEIYTKKDLLTYYPYRYNIIAKTDFSNITEEDTKIIIDGIVERLPLISSLNKGLKKISFRLQTEYGIFQIQVFNQIYLINELTLGKKITIIGKYQRQNNLITASEIRPGLIKKEPTIEPVYYTTSGLSKKNIAKYISNLLESDYEIEDYIPTYLQQKYKFIPKKVAISSIHYPQTTLSLKKARQRLKYEELFMYLLKIQYLKIPKQDNQAISRTSMLDKITNFINTLPFELTQDQNQAVNEILKDMQSPQRMNRLLQGDVGSGKTIVAFIAAYYNYLSGYQTAFMVPTSILAKQHYENALTLFKNYSFPIALLTSNSSSTEKTRIYKELKNNNIKLIIGTQALIQETIEFHSLGLVITDEQHRFGVNQRNILTTKGKFVDILSMSATPIPRTYALTIYGDMDISSIKTKPSNRKEVTTKIYQENEILEVLKKIKIEILNHHQIYVVAPSIDELSTSKENVEGLYSKMQKAFGKIAKIEYIHGKLDENLKIKTMQQFEQGKIDILISTTVIEVGVNVPNASMIIIFDANMFGLSTLHQLRGRVGRGDIPGYCILISKQSDSRLKYLENCHDGFQISEYDFQNRGEGDLFGRRQSGENGLILADIKRDYELLLHVKEDVEHFIKNCLYDDKYSYLLEELTTIEKLN